MVEVIGEGGVAVGEREGENVATVTHIIAESPDGFDAAVRVGFARASKTLRNITGLRVMEQRVFVKANKIATFRVMMEVIFILDK